MRSSLACVIAVIVAVQFHAAAQTVHTMRVRPMQARVAGLLATGVDRSATFRHLVRRIEASDVIVYIETRYDLRGPVGASMRFVTSTASDRYVRIQLNARYHDHILVALLGHELQHAVEVAEHPEVQSSDDLRGLYQRTGLRTGPDSYDSRAARDAGYLVRAEMVARPGDARMARAVSAEESRLLDGASFDDASSGPVSH